MIVDLAVAGMILAATGSAGDPCAGRADCSEFGRADVTGDGVVDRIGYRLVGYDPARPFASKTMRVIVRSGDGGRYTYDSTHRLAFEGPYGAAPIDGVVGAEIALSWLRGAHASFVEVLTFRDGALTTEKGWVRDGIVTYGVGVEWIPGATAETPIMRRCAYDDVAIGNRPAHRTTTIDFTWQGSGWVRGPATFEDYPGADDVPWQCSRFGVPGMSRVPMNVYR